MNKRNLLRRLAGLALLGLSGLPAAAQGSETYGGGIKLNANPEGTKYIRFITWHQMWGRYIQNNPGTTFNGSGEDWSYDVGLRRSRFLAYAQITPRYLILTHWGINNQTFTNGGVPGGGNTGSGAPGATTGKKPQLFMHDLWNEYAVIPATRPTVADPTKTEARPVSLSLGMGLHYWHGISRMTSGSTLNFLAVDAPIFNWPTIETTDQFARQFGIYAKGKVLKLDYRLSINKPFSINQFNPAGAPASQDIASHVPNNNWATQGYVMWQFLDQESNLLPFTVGSYLGTRKVFNLGGGWHYHPQAMGTRTSATDPTLKSHDMGLWGVDAFLDLPFGTNNMALTAYGVYYNYDFGPNYIRYVGIMNEGENATAGTAPPNAIPASELGFGAGTQYGNTSPKIGTGNIAYLQAGLLLPKPLLGSKGRLQPFGAVTYRDFEAFDEAAFNYDAGLNYFLDGHHAKITFQYSTRPVYRLVEGDAPTLERNRTVERNVGEFILQTQIYL